jgi:hypothetical protein
MQRTLFALCLALALASCGGGGSPSSPTPTIAQIAGVWRVSSRVTTVSATECVGSTLAAGGFIGTVSNSTAQISQTGATVNVTASDNASGSTTRYNGTVGESSVALTWQSCDLCVIRNLQCPGGALRDITPQADSIQAAISGSTMNGTEAVTYNVTVSGSGAPAGLLIINGAFSATKQ